MRSAPLAMSEQLVARLNEVSDDCLPAIDLVFCSDMLDLVQWRGFLARAVGTSEIADGKIAARRTHIASLPTISYFHENQWTYPTSPNAREDAHYGYTNLLTAIASDEVWFNSAFHRGEFLRESRRFVARMPDFRSSHDLDGLEQRCLVVPPGFDPVTLPKSRGSGARSSIEGETPRPLTIGWVGRWEFDKRPDRFLELLHILTKRRVDFGLVLLGPRSGKRCKPLVSIEQEYDKQIRFNGFADGEDKYRELLSQMDVVVATADHEFFGIAVCEAVSAGAIPVLPDKLSYPELVDAMFRYQSLQEAADMIERWAREPSLDHLSQECQAGLRNFEIDQVVAVIDDGVERVARCNARSEET